jgi:hypothetical protein
MRIAGALRVAAALVVAVAVAGVSTAGCQRMVEVKSGTRTICTAGEVISDDVKTIKVPAKSAGAYKVRTVIVTCDKHTQLQTLYGEAQAALAAGNIKLAEAKLAAVLAIDPTYRKAQQQTDAIKKGTKPTTDSSNPPSTTPTTTPDPQNPGGNPTTDPSLSKWAPDAITGFSAQKRLVDALSVSREYLPSGKSPALGLAIYAEQLRTSDEAKAALSRQVKAKYAKNSADIKVKGRDAYFGTDGKRFAVIGFTDGAVMVALELTTDSSPQDLKSLAEQVAAQLP